MKFRRIKYSIKFENDYSFVNRTLDNELKKYLVNLKQRIKENVEKYSQSSKLINDKYVKIKDLVLKGELIEAIPKNLTNENIQVFQKVLQNSIITGEILISEEISKFDQTIILYGSISSSVMELNLFDFGLNNYTGRKICSLMSINEILPPTIFISYSWDDKEHNEWVLNFAKQLKKENYQVKIDKLDLTIGDNFHVFMERGIKEADFVIIVFTPNYKVKASQRNGGVGFEYSLINSELYKMLANNKKFLPIIRKGEFNQSIPEIFEQLIVCDMRDDTRFDQKINEIISTINRNT